MPRVLATLLLLVALGACGAPESDEVFTNDNPDEMFTKGNPKLAGGARDTATPPAPPPTPAPRLQTRRYPGLYRRLGEDSRFQPCGTERSLTIFGPLEARVALHERFRYSSVWVGKNMFGVFQGAIVTDTVKPPPPGTGVGTIRTRFLITAVDSLRTWQSRDCGGMRVGNSQP